MHPPGADTVLIRYDEIGVKSRQVRRKMEKRLEQNIANIVDDRSVQGDVERRWSRLFIRADPDSIDDAVDAATDVFGVSSASSCISVEPELDEIVDTLAEIAGDVYTGGTFAVNARRSGDKSQHPFSSEDLEREGGSAIIDAIEDFEPEVDLDNPGTTFFVECRQDEAFIFLEKISGPGGLPLGTQERLVALVSGGYDSPVAAWEAMRRGCEIIPVYLDLGNFGGVDHVARAFETVEKLARYAPGRDMRVRKVPAGDYMERLVGQVGKTRMLSYRRFMYRVAEKIAEEEDAAGIVTGESLGQKSSQTSSNLHVTGRAVDMPIHRPLLTRDKKDIIKKAKEIGTYNDSRIDVGCNRIAPDYPETRGTVEDVQGEEPDELLDWADEAAAQTTIEEL